MKLFIFVFEERFLMLITCGLVGLIVGKSGGIVRIINRKTAERALLKGFSGKVTDVSFAHVGPVVLGVVDEVGNMFIYEIVEAEDGKIEYPFSFNK